MLRTGEILGLRSSHLFCGSKDRQVVVSLGLTKGGKDKVPLKASFWDLNRLFCW